MHTIPDQIQDEFSVTRLNALHSELLAISQRLGQLQEKTAQKSTTFLNLKTRQLELERKRIEVTEGLEFLNHEWPMESSTACKDLKRTEELVTLIQELFPQFRALIVKWTWKEITPAEQLELDHLNQKLNELEKERRALNPSRTDLMIESAQKQFEPTAP